jgi:hypothetical protein
VSWRRCLAALSAVVMLSLQPHLAGEAGAQQRTDTAVRVNATGMRILDEWIVLRFRGSQLLEDSSGSRLSLATDAPLPRVESILGARGDTVIALHFAPRPASAALQVPGTARMAVPTGAITPTSGRVVARRPFRAPRTPAPDDGTRSDWRYGWAYLVVLPADREPMPPTAMRGWLLLDVPGPRPVRRPTQ